MSKNFKNSTGTKVFIASRKIWRLLPQGVRRAIFMLFGSRLRWFIGCQLVARPALRRPDDNSAPLVVAGLFRTANGIGEGARATYRALHAAGLRAVAVDLSPQLSVVDMETDIPLAQMPDAHEGTIILQLNAPETVAALQHLKLLRGRNWYTIGYWAWELPSFPKGWDKAFPFVSELWTPSLFSCAALESHSKAPQISVFGHSLTLPKVLSFDRKKYGFPVGSFIFLTMADSMSSLQRKNPFAAILAHKRTFGVDASRILVVKTRNLQKDKQAYDDLTACINDAPNIHLLDVSLSEDERWELLNSVDAVISLHRSEGFGLVIAEAMALGKPVITTGWSGNMDFTNKDNAYLVDYTLVPCRDQYGVYRDTNSQWAEVSIAHAGEHMSNVVKTDAKCKRIALAAKETILKQTSPDELGRAMSARIYNNTLR